MMWCCCWRRRRNIHKLTGHVSDDEVSLIDEFEDESVRILSDAASSIRAYEAPVLLRRQSSLDPGQTPDTMTSEDKQCRILCRVLRKEGYALRDQLTDPQMIRRHYRGCKGNMDKTLTSIKNSIKWREDSLINAFPHIFSENSLLWNIQMQAFMRFENSTGKCYVRGYDRDGRATLVMHPRNENSPSGEDAFTHILYNIERAIACTRRRTNGALNTFNVIVDFEGYASTQSPSLNRTKESLSIAQNHYPERLHRAFLVDTTGFMKLLWGLVKPFINPITKAKIVYIPREKAWSTLSKTYEARELESRIGGKAVRDFSSEEYLTSPFYIAFGELDVDGTSVKGTESRLDDDYFYNAFSRHSLESKTSIKRPQII